MNTLLTLASAVALPLALPNEIVRWGLAPLGVVAVAPVLMAIYRAPTWRHAARLGALFGAVSTAIGNYWLAFFGEFSVWTIGGTVLGYTGYNYILFGYLFHAVHGLRGRGSAPAIAGKELRHTWFDLLRPFRVAVVWTGYEWFKSVGFLGYPWGLVGYPLAQSPHIAQIAELTGVWGLTFLAALINASIAELAIAAQYARRLEWRPLAAAILAVGVAGGYGAARIRAIEPRRSVEMLLVQQNVDSWAPGRFSEALETAQRLTIEGIERHRASGGAPPAAVVWSETALRRPFPDVFYEQRPETLPFTEFLDRIGIPLVTGLPVHNPAAGGVSNGAAVLAPDGRITATYGKQQLVPFAEGIPFWEFAVVREFFRTVVGLVGTWVPGNASTLIEIPSAPVSATSMPLAIGTPICFEDGFGWVPREMVSNGAEVLVNLTNNSWSRQDSAQIQHYVAARLRTIETRTTLVRGTNSGLSGVVDATGRLRSALPMFEQEAAIVTVPIYPPPRTLYLIVGDLFGWLAAIAAVAGAAIHSLIWLYRPAAGATEIGAAPMRPQLSR